MAVICSEEQLASWKERAADYVFSELLTEEEYTVDCFTDQNGNLLVMSMRQRIRVKSGISVNTRLVPLPEAVGKIGRIINENLKLRGAWFFQVKKNSSEQFKLLEVAPRVAGSMCTSRLSGFNYILNSIYTAMEVAIRSIPRLLDAIEVDRAFVSRYDLGISYDTVYLDFDDTVTLHQKVNSQMMALIYQWKNQGKTIKILTRHAQDIYQPMETLCIDHRLFDQIIEVEEKQLKSQYIVDEKAIFIDDSFRERFDVSEKTGIPVFDVDGIEGLLDWRY